MPCDLCFNQICFLLNNDQFPGTMEDWLGGLLNLPQHGWYFNHLRLFMGSFEGWCHSKHAMFSFCSNRLSVKLPQKNAVLVYCSTQISKRFCMIPSTPGCRYIFGIRHPGIDFHLSLLLSGGECQDMIDISILDVVFIQDFLQLQPQGDMIQFWYAHIVEMGGKKHQLTN